MASPTSSEPKTLEEYIASKPLDRQRTLRIALTQLYNLINSWTPEHRGDNTFVSYMLLKRGVEAAFDQPFEPDAA